MTEKYNKLNELWEKQRELYSQWRFELRASVFSVREHFANSFGLKGKTWNESLDPQRQSKKPYISLLNLAGEEFGNDISELVYDDGSARFNLLIVFERASNSYPKGPVTLPLAVQFMNKEVRYGILNTKTDEVGFWFNTLEDLEGKVVELLEQHFSFDPLEGFENRKTIGFL
ncbi:hypothetical protein HPY16_14960 [Vibrio cholerae]|uniref:hypothetical protein n=1 Tax=Vibrio cholerae TaxID=666 RepID=UPI00158183BC|nr:hypothetical protein [Vibrio cholerae]ELH5152388.1 hypothetical protein [Vibrio cholerae]QKU90947.1 hypothetical protein HPY16_14960 [Vibrio cholerae]